MMILAFLAGMASAQEAELLIPGVTVVEETKQQVAPVNPLANCILNASAAACHGVAADPDEPAFESAIGAPSVAFESLVFDPNAGSVSVSTAPPAKPVNYEEPVKPHVKVELPAVAISILFDYNSSAIRYDQNGKIGNLAAALNDPQLQGYSFAVIGHTDAAGSNAYNCDLSRQRATSVAAALLANQVYVPLIPVGFGEHTLKNTHDPKAAENRRVTFLRLPKDQSAVLNTAYAICPS